MSRYSPGSEHPRWKGEEAQTRAIHMWMRKHYWTGCCEQCGHTDRPTQFARKDHDQLTRKRDAWLELCKPCHAAFDDVAAHLHTPEAIANRSVALTGRTAPNKGVPHSSQTRAKIAAKARARPATTHCKRGHEFTEENTYLYRGKRQCQTCRYNRNHPKSPQSPVS